MAAAAHAAGAALAISDCPSSSHPQQHQQQQQLQPQHQQLQHLAFARSARSPIALSSFLGSRIDRALCLTRPVQGSRSASWVSPVNEVAVDGSSNASAVAATKLEVKSENDAPPGQPPAAATEATTEATISAFMTDVANLIKLVDSRDIVELELKHLDYEIVIRKKEALPPPRAPQTFLPPQVAAQTPFPAYATPPAAAPSPAPAPAPASTPAPAAAPASDLPPMVSPMAGTFYRSPAPGEPVFVKVGDKVQKGQVICIVEAMKLMNEIEADQTGTIVDILAEDGKPVSVDTPLFAIKP